MSSTKFGLHFTISLEFPYSEITNANEYLKSMLQTHFAPQKKKTDFALNKYICEDCFSKTILKQQDLKDPLEKSLRAMFDLYFHSTE